MAASLDKRAFNDIVRGWRAMSDEDLHDAIERARAWVKWPEQHYLLTEMARELGNRFTKQHGTELDGHAIFAPSAAHEWAYCSGSLHERLAKGDTAGEDAAMGTVAHQIAEEWGRSGKEPRHLLGRQMSAVAGGETYTFTIDEQWLDDARQFVEWCNEVPGDHFHETKVDLSAILPIPGQRGTADHFVCAPGVLTITDLKNGMVRVYAKENPQAMLYAAGVFMLWDWIYGFERIVIRICHPRLDVFDVWECSRQELLDFMEWIKHRALAALPARAPRTPSEKSCRYCGGKRTCAARALALETMADKAFEDSMDDSDLDGKVTFSAQEVDDAADRIQSSGLSLPDMKSRKPRDLRLLAIERIMLQRKDIENFLKAVWEEGLRRVENGHELTYFYLGPGRTEYRWKNEDEAVEAIVLEYGIPSKDVRPPAILSKDAMTKLIKARTKLKPAPINKFLAPLLESFAGKRGLKRRDGKEDQADDEAVQVESMLGDADDYEL